MKHKLLAFLLCFGSCLLFSSSVSAVSLTLDVTPTGNSWSRSGGSICYYNDGTSLTKSGNDCNLGSGYSNKSGLVKMVGGSNISLVEGNYYQSIFSIMSLSSSMSSWGIVLDAGGSSDYLDFVSMEELDKDWLTQVDGVTSVYAKRYVVTYRANTTGSYPFTVGGSGTLVYGPNNYDWYVKFLDVTEYELSDSSVEESAESAASSLEDMNSKDDSDRSNIESQSSSGSDAADSAQSDTETQGTTLLGAFSSFVGSLTSTSSGSCSISVDTGLVDFGSVDLCAVEVPTAFQVISSLVVIGFAVPLSINTSRKLISLFRSFTG